MDCADFLNRYSEYDDSLVPPAEADRFRSHMAACESCTRYDRVLRKGRMLARQLPRVEPSDDFVPRLRARLWERSIDGGRLLERPGRSAHALPAVTLLLVLIALFGLLGGGDAPRADLLHADGGSTAASRAVVGESARESGTERSRGALYQLASRSPSRPSATLPPMPGPAPRPWTTARVDREVRASYSPLITGPPAYRDARPRPAISISTYRTLD